MQAFYTIDERWRGEINWHFGVYLSKLWTGFDEILRSDRERPKYDRKFIVN